MPKKKTSSIVKKLPENDDENYVRKPVVLGDSYQNVPARTGVGTPNLINAGNYPIIRITEDYPLILSLYRGSWIVRRIVDTVANDMYKDFPLIDSQLTPEQVQAFDRVIQKTQTVKRLRSAAKWGRLFGGAACIIVIDGADDLMEPLNIDD